MPPKLAEIDRLALAWFKNFLQLNDYQFDENGNIVPAPGKPDGPLLGSEALSPDEAARPMREQWQLLNDLLMTLRYRFEAFYDLDPLDFTVFVGHLGGTTRQVAHQDGWSPSSVYDRIEVAFSEWILPVDGLITEEQWTGGAATKFRDEFLKHFYDAARQQQSYAQILAVIPQTYHEAVTTAHRYLLTIADTCIARLSGESGAPGQAYDVEVLSWASMITGALSLFPPLSPIAGPISLGTAIVGYARSKRFEAPNEAPIEGTVAPQVLRTAIDLVVDVESGLAELDRTLAESLNHDLNSPTGFASPGLRLERPELANGPATMGTLTIDKYDVPMNLNVVVSLVNLYKAGYVNLPGAAGEYAAAVATLALCTPLQSSGTYFLRSAQRFDEARNQLAGILRNTAESLTACGATLVACAKEYQLTDEEQAEYLLRVDDLVQPTADPPATPTRGPV
ncbi:hypothetical protein K1W54_16930 [Micromonospora sp. CPCC 205371]|nr:hypothetical protein [Micromonospora sp. CPCC 205371]